MGSPGFIGGYLMEWKVCPCCDKVFFKSISEHYPAWEERKYCSRSCATIERNKSRRMYPEIDGVPRSTVIYRCSPKRRERSMARDMEVRREVIEHLGGVCIRCGYKTDIRALVLDHKNGNGSEDRRRLGGKIARYYINHLGEAEKELQVLCSNCNKIKAIENKEHNKSRRLVGF